jgi:hypothetical protein
MIIIAGYSSKEKATAENDEPQLIRDPTNRLQRLLSKSLGPV